MLDFVARAVAAVVTAAAGRNYHIPVVVKKNTIKWGM